MAHTRWIHVSSATAASSWTHGPLVLTIAIWTASACTGSPKIEAIGRMADGAAPATGDEGGGKLPTVDGGLQFMPADARAGDGSGDGAVCAYETRMAKQVPLDLLLVLDRSSSMVGAKWAQAVSGLSAFLRDPASAGLGVGLQFFPGGGLHPCESDAE